MDRDLTPSQRRARWWSLAGRLLLGALALGAVGWAGARYLRPSLDLADLRIETVERGPLEASISAQGIVIPRERQTVSSPVAAEIRPAEWLAFRGYAKGLFIGIGDDRGNEVDIEATAGFRVLPTLELGGGFRHLGVFVSLDDSETTIDLRYSAVTAYVRIGR